MSVERLLQLDPSVPLDTPKGPGQALVLIDYGVEHHLVWVVADDVTREIWAWPNPQVRARANPTMGRK